MTKIKLNFEVLRLARESRGVTQADLAEKLGITQGLFSKIEKGFSEIDENQLRQLSEILNYPNEFFQSDKKVNRVEGHFRRKKNIPVKEMKEYISRMTLKDWHLLSLLDEIELPRLNLPRWDLEIDGDLAACASYVREVWKVPPGRIENLTKLLEDKGFVIFTLDLGDDLDGFSCYSTGGNVPLIFINKNISPDRYRLTAAHEAFHHILHFGKKTDPDEIETQAYGGGLNFLIPRNTILPYFSKISIEKLGDLKRYWGVSMSALVRYAYDLNMITKHQYKYYMIQLSKLGYRKAEPVTVCQESPTLFKEIINVFITELGYTRQELARLMMITPEDLNREYIDDRRFNINHLRIV
jgi:Zn-dependent peptidase ImmA (M78 family)/DNA-binding XRE family transcriptional regulator